MERRLIHLLNEEVALQKKLEKDLDIDVPEGLQNWNLANVDMLTQYYQADEALKSASKNKREIVGLLGKCRHWDLPERDRKWFHF